MLKGLRLLQPDNCPNEIYEIMKNCWTTEASLRPKFNEIIENLREFQSTQRKSFLVLNKNNNSNNNKEEKSDGIYETTVLTNDSQNVDDNYMSK